jgi:hypothetical protein
VTEVPSAYRGPLQLGLELEMLGLMCPGATIAEASNSRTNALPRSGLPTTEINRTDLSLQPRNSATETGAADLRKRSSLAIASSIEADAYRFRKDPPTGPAFVKTVNVSIGPAREVIERQPAVSRTPTRIRLFIKDPLLPNTAQPAKFPANEKVSDRCPTARYAMKLSVPYSHSSCGVRGWAPVRSTVWFGFPFNFGPV